jgi:hypothetical protein
VCGFCAIFWSIPAPASAFDAGGHLGVGLDTGSIHLGADLIFPLAELSPNVRLAVWPSAAFVINDGADGVLVSADFPFQFEIAHSIVQPFAGPGLALAIFDDETAVKLNVIGGLFIDTGAVRPFAELALRFVRGTFVDLLLGVVVDV